MDFSREILFFFSALGAFNGLFLGLYFLTYVRPRELSHYFLGALLIAISIRTGKSVFYYFKPDLGFAYLQVGLSACIFIGPFLYAYVRSALHPHNPSNWKFHIVPFFLLALGLAYWFPFGAHIEFWRNYLIKGIYLQWLIYIVLSGVLLSDLIPNLYHKKIPLKNTYIWVLSVYLGTFLIWVAYYFCGFGSYILGALLFSFLLYLLLLLLILGNYKRPFQKPKSLKYQDKKIDRTEANLLLGKLDEIMAAEKAFRNPNLKLPDLAKRLNVLPHRLSKVLNDNLGKSFPLYINEYRIQAAKELLRSRPEFSIEGICYECGFNSKSTFYSTFKKLVGQTPASYRAENLN